MLLLAGIFKHHHMFVPSEHSKYTIKYVAHPESNQLGVKKCLQNFIEVSPLQHVDIYIQLHLHIVSKEVKTHGIS